MDILAHHNYIPSAILGYDTMNVLKPGSELFPSFIEAEYAPKYNT